MLPAALCLKAAFAAARRAGKVQDRFGNHKNAGFMCLAEESRAL